MSLIGDTGAYSSTTLSRREVEALGGSTVLDFGTSWCGVCRATAPVIAEALAAHPAVRHLAVEDGPGRPPTRSQGSTPHDRDRARTEQARKFTRRCRFAHRRFDLR